jgi:hypothetical protein
MRIRITSKNLPHYLHTALTAMTKVHNYWQEYGTHFISFSVSMLEAGYGMRANACTHTRENVLLKSMVN